MTFAIKQKSLCAYFADAISEYRKENDDRLPKLIELHPELFIQFLKELDEAKSLILIKDRSISWHGVLIAENVMVEYPKMHGYIGEVIFI